MSGKRRDGLLRVGAGKGKVREGLMPVEWDFLRGPIPEVHAALIESFEHYWRHKRVLKVGVSSNPLLTFLDHAEDEELGPGQYVGERLVGLYETYSLDEALAAMELLLAHARLWRPDKRVERDEQHSILEEDEDLPFFVYVLGDSIHEFPGGPIGPG
jgi:hypothetical protein